MSRITPCKQGIQFLTFIATMLLASCAFAGQAPTDTSKPSTPKSGQPTTPPASVATGVMQLKKQMTGDFSYRFINSGAKGSEAAAAPVPLPTPPAGDAIVAIPVPSTVAKDGMLEILDNERGNVARLPITTKSVVDLGESAFTLAQRVKVPVQSKGLGIVGAQVTMTSAAKKFTQTRLLQSDDNGVARFDLVPLNEPVTVTVSYASNPPESQTRTLPTARPAEPWPAIVVNWTDAKTVAAPVNTASTSSSSGATTGTGSDNQPREIDRSSRRSYDEGDRFSRQPESNPLNGIVSTVVSLLFLAAVAYGVMWSYKTGKLQAMLDKIGISTGPVAASATGIPDPFAKANRTPIQPITEGTADPFAGGVGAASMAPAPPIADGPRLVATAGAYAGNIFPISGPLADIGRDAGNAVPLPNDTNASRRHATIQTNGGQFQITDNGSSNGTFVNGVRVASQSPQAIRPGDEVQVGLTRFRFEA